LTQIQLGRAATCLVGGRLGATVTAGPGQPELVRTLANLAFLAENAGGSVLARESSAEAQRVARTSLPPTHPVHRAIGSLP
jgi:hypothetical protein